MFGAFAMVLVGIADASPNSLSYLAWFGFFLVLRAHSDTSRPALDVLVFGLLPIWGLLLNQDMSESCERLCPGDSSRALATPEVYGLVLLHLATAGGYAISRRRAEDLPVKAEPWIVGLLLTGVILHLALTVQLLDLVPSLIFFPLTLPVMAPFASIALFWCELARRLRAAAQRSGVSTAAGLTQGLLRTPLILGAHALLQGLWRGHPTGALDVFARTCTHTLSSLPLGVVSTSCGGHYLCTVAANGHPALVRPERLGVRGGKVIIVNRQLAIANAFEELLHARWPRFGRAARLCYDTLAIPICRYIRSRWLADVVYLGMKPAEWLFYLALLMFDQHSPEERIERMYR